MVPTLSAGSSQLSARINRHFQRCWHHHLAVWCTIAALLILSAGSATAYTRWHGHGYRPGPLPPVLHIAGGRVPPAWFLNRYIARVHNQGNSNSCVGQTLSTIEEITQAERDSRRARRHKTFSAGFIWNQVNGGQNVGVTYQAAFGVLTQLGDAQLRDFPYDGSSGYWIFPPARSYAAAAPYRFRSWRSINAWDRHTIEYELSQGRPIAVAMPILASTYDHWQTARWITGQSGDFYFWHSMTIAGYNRWGVEVLNSWGKSWGDGGHAMVTWQVLVDAGAALVISQPRPQLAAYRRFAVPRYTVHTGLRGAP